MKRLLIYVFIFLFLGSLGGFITAPNIPLWYAALAKPAFTPPNYVFAPAWTVLYTMLAVFWWNLLRKPLTAETKKIKILFLVQFGLNLLWTPVFFGLHSILGGLALIISLDICTFLLLLLSFRENKKSSLLLVPYFMWLLFASLLNFYIFLLN